MRRARGPWPIAVALAALPAGLAADTLRSWDFTRGLQGWEPNFNVANVRTTASGIEFDSTGIDPWLTSPAVDCPADRALRFTVRLRSGADGNGQVFYGTSFSEANSVRFAVAADGAWHEYAVSIPAQGAGTRFRLDPATGPGAIAVAWARLESLAPIVPPALVPPVRPVKGTPAPYSVASGPLEVVHYRQRFGGLVVRVAGVEVASSHDAERLGHIDGTSVAWRELGTLAPAVTAAAGSLTEEVRFTDAGGGHWTVRRAFAAGAVDGTIDVTAQVSCDAARQAAHVSWLTLFPGLGTFGGDKGQALLAGVEYLEREPSSSTADLTGPDHVRLVPHPGKITFPLMALERGGQWVGLAWTLSDLAAAVFDTPDRVFSSGAHLLGLWAPNVGSLRPENSLWTQLPFAVEPAKPAQVRLSILGGSGTSVAPAVAQYVALRGLPAVPSYAGGLAGAFRLLAGGWLDSDCHAGDGLWRHAVWPGFNPQPASDAIAFLRWLANHTADSALAARMRSEASTALAKRRTDDPTFQTGVAHVQWPIPPLLFGNVPGYLASRAGAAQGQAAAYDAGGVLHYPQPGDDPKYGSTHFADHADGYSARTLASILEAAQLSGSATLVATALSLLDKQAALYADAVPRGAQTWEIPLHTPDVLAAGWLVKCCVIGYELTGKAAYLDGARYWAWTGLPFVYLDPWAKGDIGPYATIAVLGASNWTSPVWIGRPVQWCGLVYRSWLGRLAVHDPGGPWARIAKGITAAGLKMTWPADDAARQGLLPDSFPLDIQSRDGPAINPGTVQASVAELYGQGSLYGVRRAAALGWLVHAPSEIRDFRDTPSSVSFAVDGWGPDGYSVLLSRVAVRPEKVLARAPGAADWLPVTNRYDAANRWLVVDAAGGAEFLIVGRNKAPTVSLSAPADGTAVALGAEVAIRADAADPDGGVAKVEFLVDGVPAAADATPPYEAVWRASAAGTHTIAARATDDLGATAAATVRVTAERPFVRGDANASGEVDITDAIAILSFLFLGTARLDCPATGDVSGDGQMDISDPLFLLEFLFLGGAAPPAPFPDCGILPGPAVPDCPLFPACGP